MRTYGHREIEGFSQLDYEMLSFAMYKGFGVARCRRWDNFRNIVRTLWPKLEWNPWLERLTQGLCEYDFVGLAGCGASGKTFGCALYSVVWWLCAPDASAVVMTSTTRAMVRRRIWAVVQQLFSTMEGGQPGNFLDSQTMWQAKKGDDKHAIFAIAVRDGTVTKAADFIQGIHTKRGVLVVLDEATSIPEAIDQAVRNLQKGAQSFQLVKIANPGSRLDSHGRFCEPDRGWPSVGVKDDEWETVRQLNGKPGLCMRFDGLKSPNVLAGKVVYPYLITKEQIDSDEAYSGGASDPSFWRYCRGFWPPDSLQETVLTPMLVEAQGSRGEWVFEGETAVVGGCDPAFGGGDSAVLRFARVGRVKEGVTGVQLLPCILLNVSAESPDPVEWQLSRQIKEKCLEVGCLPERLCVDSTGRGSGVVSDLVRVWSARVNRVEFGGSATERVISHLDSRVGKDVYDRRVTELWFQVRVLVESGQLKGLDREAEEQFCTRPYTEEKRKKVLMTKRDYKELYGKSPDEADATVLVVEACLLSGLQVATANDPVDQGKAWREQVGEGDELFDLPGETLEELAEMEYGFAD